MSPAATAPARIAAIDAIRGFAVLGILVMNIVGMGLPSYAYVDPHHAGGATGANLIAWGLAYVLADGKMRALFTMLFGASIAIAADRDEAPAIAHYRRMAWLFVFGMAHAWLLWFGDILTLYAVTGAILFIGWRWSPGALLATAALCFAAMLADDLLAWRQLAALKAAAAPGGAPAAIAAWDAVRGAIPSPAALAQEAALYRGGFADVFAARAPVTRLFQTQVLILSLPETLGYAAIGLALHRLRFFTGGWRGAAYRAWIAAGIVALLLYLPVVRLLVDARFDPAVLPLADACSFALRPFVVMGYAAALVLLVRAGCWRRPMARLAAAGRMTLSNYLGSTLVATTIFYGYGLGLYGQLGRAQLYGIVALIWILILAWSQPWLGRFAYGPAEWLWRALSRWSRPTVRRI